MGTQTVRSGLDGPRVACVGSNRESQVALEGLLAHGARVVAVVTRPPQRPGKICDYVDLHELCRTAGIPTIDTVNINSAETLAALGEVAPDYIYTLGWSQLFRDDLLAIPSDYVVGSHPTALPFGRGRAPVPWTILQDVRRSAVTLFRMERSVDAGRILMQEWFDVPAGSYASEVYSRVSEALSRAYCRLYELHRTGQPLPEVAQADDATFRAKRTPADGYIDFHRPAAEIERLVRAASQPYPGAYTYFGNDRVVIWQASADAPREYLGTPGQVLLHRGEQLLVQAGDRPLWLGEFSIDGQTVDASRFAVGAKFGVAVADELVSLRREVAELRQALDTLRQTQNQPQHESSRRVA